MLRSLTEYVKLSANSLAGRVVGGTIIVVPFVIAAVFALAAIYMSLRNSYGDVMAAVIMAIAFTLIGIVAAVVVMARIRHQEEQLEALREETRQSAITSALLAVNPALVLGVGRVAYGLFRRAPVLTAMVPLAAGFLLAMASANQRRREAREAAAAPSVAERKRTGNSRGEAAPH